MLAVVYIFVELLFDFFKYCPKQIGSYFDHFLEVIVNY